MPTPLDRFFEAAECRTQVELAQFLGIRQSSVADAKKRGSIPAEWLVRLLKVKKVNPEWILTGEGAQNLVPSECPKSMDNDPIYGNNLRSLEDYSSEELMTEIFRRTIKNIRI